MTSNNIQLSFEEWLQGERCCHCGKRRSDVRHITQDHVPSRGLFKNPESEALPTVPVCACCNRRFSACESYAYSFLSSVLTGTHQANDQILPKARNVLKSDRRMREQIWSSKNAASSILSWEPDDQLWKKFIVKNARGHAFLNAKMIVSCWPDKIWFKPLMLFTEEDTEDFRKNEIEDPVLWSGTLRGLEHQAKAFMTSFEDISDNYDEWISLEKGEYFVSCAHGENRICVRTIIHDYLATKVVWRNLF